MYVRLRNKMKIIISNNGRKKTKENIFDPTLNQNDLYRKCKRMKCFNCYNNFNVDAFIILENQYNIYY